MIQTEISKKEFRLLKDYVYDNFLKAENGYK